MKDLSKKLDGSEYKRKRTPIDGARVRELYFYDDGKLFRKSTKKSIGGKSTSGYLVAMMDRKHLLVHRMIWAYHNDSCPDLIDHKNNNKLDNRIQNLQPLTPSQNNKKRITKKNGMFQFWPNGRVQNFFSENGLHSEFPSPGYG